MNIHEVLNDPQVRTEVYLQIQNRSDAGFTKCLIYIPLNTSERLLVPLSGNKLLHRELSNYFYKLPKHLSSQSTQLVKKTRQLIVGLLPILWILITDTIISGVKTYYRSILWKANRMCHQFCVLNFNISKGNNHCKLLTYEAQKDVFFPPHFPNFQEE